MKKELLLVPVNQAETEPVLASSIMEPNHNYSIWSLNQINLRASFKLIKYQHIGAEKYFQKQSSLIIYYMNIQNLTKTFRYVIDLF
jgi:hypothetical protein